MIPLVQQDTLKRLFSEQEAAEYLGVSRSYLRQDRMNGKFNDRTPGPEYCRFGTMIRYTKEALDKWIDDNCIER
ncbi:MAG: helix-turn-helix domain-containing protein [Pseudomonadota bacterium]